MASPFGYFRGIEVVAAPERQGHRNFPGSIDPTILSSSCVNQPYSTVRLQAQKRPAGLFAGAVIDSHLATAAFLPVTM